MTQAKGIPDRDEFGNHQKLEPGKLYDYFRQLHHAHRAGTHEDIRIGDKDLGLLSWAARKGLPKPGEKHLAVQQPVHAHSYGPFEGEIESGYGAGTVKKQDQGQVLVTKVEPGAVHFTTAHGRYPERFALIKPKIGKNWLMLNTTKTEPIPYEKVHYKQIPPEQAEKVLGKLQPGASVQAKVDGAASLTKLFKDHAEIVSYRASKKSGHPIVHTERVFHGRPETKFPRELVGSVLRGELYGRDQADSVIQPQRLGGLLNSGVAKSIHDQKSKGVKLRNLLFDVQQLGSGPSELGSYSDRLRLLKDKFLPHLQSDVFHGPEEHNDPQSALKLWDKVKSRKDPYGHEGVVIHPPQGKPSKIKPREEHDVHIREFFPGMGKYKDVGVGGFKYSHEPEGPIAGEVGTGLSDELRKELHINPKAYIGRVARVHAQEKHPSGALRAPSLIALHEDKPEAEVASPLKKLTDRDGLEKTVKTSNDALKKLIKAKSESDRRNYSSKHDLVRQLIMKDPDSFMIDSQEGDIYGLTHKPTGFKIHMPAKTIPTNLMAKHKQTLTSTVQ